MKILPSSFYARSTPCVAKDLLGKILVRMHKGKQMSGIIVETEAYTINDPACHAYRGKTARTTPLFGPIGHTYVYFIYGTHYCLNIVARDAHTAAGGVLIRALEPHAGIEVMQHQRGSSYQNLTNGPGKLTQAMQITTSDSGLSVTQHGALYVLDAPTLPDEAVENSGRIGISVATELPWRFLIKNNTWVSK